MFDIPWPIRFVILICLMTMVAIIDYLLNRKSLWKAKEYASVLLAGLIGALFGALNDQITCSISPDYFNVGKGLELDSNFRINVGILGAEAGFFVGFLIYGIYLIIIKSNRDTNLYVYRSLLFKLKYPLYYSIILIPILIVIVLCIKNVIPEYSFFYLVPALRVRLFLIVWGWHIGLYFGAFFGAVHGSLLVKKRIKNIKK